jgi:hypothetical protein
MIHTLCIMRSWCRTEPVLLFFWRPHERLAASTFASWLLILLPIRQAGPPFCLLIHGDPIFPRVHAHPCPLVHYRSSVLLLAGVKSANKQITVQSAEQCDIRSLAIDSRIWPLCNDSHILYVGLPYSLFIPKCVQKNGIQPPCCRIPTIRTRQIHVGNTVRPYNTQLVSGDFSREDVDKKCGMKGSSSPHLQYQRTLTAVRPSRLLIGW